MYRKDTVVADLMVPGRQGVIRGSVQEIPRRPRQGNDPRYVSGPRGLARVLGITVDQAREMVSSGIIDAALRANGPDGVTIIDWAEARRLWVEQGRPFMDKTGML